MKPRDKCRLCFLLLAFAGVSAIFVGPAMDTLHPHMLLDHVLRQDELQDKKLRERTLDMLVRANRVDWISWSILGVSVAVLGIIGYRATTKLPD